eukprot:jgi/Ulvmu1/7359/UM036_0019.1
MGASSAAVSASTASDRRNGGGGGGSGGGEKRDRQSGRGAGDNEEKDALARPAPFDPPWLGNHGSCRVPARVAQPGAVLTEAVWQNIIAEAPQALREWCH